MLAGVALAVKTLRPHAKIIAVEAENVGSFSAALKAGKPVTIATKPTLADGLAGRAAAVMLAQGKAALDDIVASSEEDVASAIAYLWIGWGYKGEGAGECSVAALLSTRGGRHESPRVVEVGGGRAEPSSQPRWGNPGRARGGSSPARRTGIGIFA